MIKIYDFNVEGMYLAMQGMRFPMNSWSLQDSNNIKVGNNDLNLAKRLARGGSVHAKYRRMIQVYIDISAPLYWWKEADTYKVGTVTNSCSTMHKIADKAFELGDFSTEYLTNDSLEVFTDTIIQLNFNRRKYLETKNKDYWWQMIQLLPSSYNQRRMWMVNYETLYDIYHSRKGHKLDEWNELCTWIEKLPYAKEMILVE